MSTHVTSTTQMFNFIKRCEEVGLRNHLYEVVNSAVLAEETRMSLIRAKINGEDTRGPKIIFREHLKSFHECVRKLNEAAKVHKIHSPAYGMLDVFNVFA